MSRFINLLYIIPFLFIPVFSASGNIKTTGPSSLIQVKDNLLTVKVRDIPLKKVLMEIAKQKHIKVVFYASADNTLITNFSSLPMEKGLVKLLRNYSYAFTYSPEKFKGGEHEIRKVVILSNGGGSRHRGMESEIAYREEPHLYDGPHDDDMHYQESEGMYNEYSDYQEEEMYDEESDYQESENMYTEAPGYQENEGTNNEYPDYQMYDEDPGYQESEDTYPYESGIPGEDIPEGLGYSEGRGYAGFN